MLLSGEPYLLTGPSRSQDFGRGQPVAVRWSPARPALLFVLDALSTLHCFDLLQNAARPVFATSVVSPGEAGLLALATKFEVGNRPERLQVQRLHSAAALNTCSALVGAFP